MLWCQVERALKASLTDLGIEPERMLGVSLDEWHKKIGQAHLERFGRRDICDDLQSDLRQALDVRNQICHGLIGTRAGGREGEPPAALTVELESGERKEYCWDELQEMFRWLSRSRYAISEMTDAVLEEDEEQAREILSRVRWRSQHP